MREKRYVCIGKVAKAHGIRGEIKIYPYSQEPESLCAYENLYFVTEGLPPGEATSGQDTPEETGAVGRLPVTRCRVQGKYAIVALSGFTDRSSADRLVGLEVHVDRAAMAELQKDEFYWHELEGMTVVSDSGEELGTVASLFSTGAYDMMVISGKGGEVMIPALKEFIVAIDPDVNKVTVALVPGLLEIND